MCVVVIIYATGLFLNVNTDVYILLLYKIVSICCL